MDVIERADDQDKLIIQNSIRYLDNLTQIKELNNPTLKSLYRTKCKLMELRRRVYLPLQKSYQRCQLCFMNFSEGKTEFEVRPAKLSIFAKKIISKVKKKDVLTDYQRTYYKKLLKKYPNGFETQNKMVLTCSYCKKETEVWMGKPKRKRLALKNITPPKKKKKPKKKDKLCGLNESVVLLSSKKEKSKKKNVLNSKKSDSNKTLNTSNIFVVPAKRNKNNSVSLANTRDFPTSDYIPLDSNVKGKQSIKLSRKKENIIKPLSVVVSKSKERLQKKNLNSLNNRLKRANETKDRSSSKLKDFLTSL